MQNRVFNLYRLHNDDGYYGVQYVPQTQLARDRGAQRQRCQNNGKFDARGRRCLCSPDFEGKFCEKPKCKNGGDFLFDTKTCSCPVSYTGIKCERCLYGFEADGDSCMCHPRFTGENCSTVICDNLGVPHRDNSTLCSCLPFHTGTYCEQLGTITYVAAGGGLLALILLILCCCCYFKCCRKNRKGKKTTSSPKYTGPRQAYEAPYSAHDEAIESPSMLTLDRLREREPSAPSAPTEEHVDLPSYYDALDLPPPPHGPTVTQVQDDVASPSAPPCYGTVGLDRHFYY